MTTHPLLRLIFFGPPGVGKGTQAKIIAKRFMITHISTGDMLRAAVAKGTDLGRKAKEIIDAGHLVPDDVMVGIVREVLTAPETARGFILDGFPRTVPQAEALSKIFRELKIDNYRVVEFDADREELVRRLSQRVVCRADGKIYTMATDGVSPGMPCPDCGGELYQRDDDKEETVRRRLTVYEQQTAPVLEYYRKLKVAFHVDGSGPVAEVSRQIAGMLSKES